MSGLIRVFVNERPVEIAAGSNVSAAVLAFDLSLGSQLLGGKAYATDGRGIEISHDVLLAPGAIIRVVVSARRSGDGGGGDGGA